MGKTSSSAVKTLEYGDAQSSASPYEPVMFSRTNTFSFFEAAHKRMRIDTAALGTRGLTLSRVTSSGHDINLTEHQNLTLLIPTSGRIDVATGSQEYRADPGQSLAFRPNSRHTRVTPAPRHAYEAFVLMVPLTLIAAERLDASPLQQAGARGGGIVVGADVGVVASLRDLFGFLMADLARKAPALRTAKALSAAEVLVLEGFRSYLETLSDKPERQLAGPTATVRRAEEFMRANYTDALSVGDIAEAAGVNGRTLQSAFRQVRGTSPRASLTTVRLQSAHDRITRGGEGQNITQIALDCGFTHLGRFSQLYRATYGERPSETMRRLLGKG